MSQEDVELVHRVVDAWNRGDVEAFLSGYDPDCEVVFPPEVPEPGPFHGHAELKQWVDGFLAAWESHRAEVVEVMERGRRRCRCAAHGGARFREWSGFWIRQTPTSSRSEKAGLRAGRTSTRGSMPSKPPACRSSTVMPCLVDG
jgi:SnoaL-like domain